MDQLKLRQLYLQAGFGEKAVTAGIVIHRGRFDGLDEMIVDAGWTRALMILGLAVIGERNQAQALQLGNRAQPLRELAREPMRGSAQGCFVPRRCDRRSIGPRGILDQSKARRSAPISPPLAKKSSSPFAASLDRSVAARQPAVKDMVYLA
ncbi:MAG: hypothetical protein ACRETZ_17605 [Steroidobacteraceae bacterium]